MQPQHDHDRLRAAHEQCPNLQAEWHRDVQMRAPPDTILCIDGVLTLTEIGASEPWFAEVMQHCRTAQDGSNTATMVESYAWTPPPDLADLTQIQFRFDGTMSVECLSAHDEPVNNTMSLGSRKSGFSWAGCFPEW
ncbi:MAG: hypothetical protein ACI8PZ_003874 [Myxococcota bacterium]|jgi:hypothetical protein